jgi:hypothetical protein
MYFQKFFSYLVAAQSTKKTAGAQASQLYQEAGGT